jgi:hypothetical protein
MPELVGSIFVDPISDDKAQWTPQAAGAHFSMVAKPAWTPGVNTPSTATYVQSTTDGNIDRFNFTAPTPPAGTYLSWVRAHVYHQTQTNHGIDLTNLQVVDGSQIVQLGGTNPHYNTVPAGPVLSSSPKRAFRQSAAGTSFAAKRIVQPGETIRQQLVLNETAAQAALTTVYAVKLEFGYSSMQHLDANTTAFVGANTRAPEFLLGGHYDGNGTGVPKYLWWETDSDYQQQLRAMVASGYNLLKIAIPFSQFMSDQTTPVVARMTALQGFVDFCESIGMRLLLTANNQFQIADRAAWFDALTVSNRWTAQANHLASLAQYIGYSPAVAVWDMINEPFSTHGNQYPTDDPPNGYGFSQALMTTAQNTGALSNSTVVQNWTTQMLNGLKTWDVGRPAGIGVQTLSGGVNAATDEFGQNVGMLGFSTVHSYPEPPWLNMASATAEVVSFSARAKVVGLPLLMGETGTLFYTTGPEMLDWWRRMRPMVAGICSYWNAAAVNGGVDTTGNLGLAFNNFTVEANRKARRVLDRRHRAQQRMGGRGVLARRIGRR